MSPATGTHVLFHLECEDSTQTMLMCIIKSILWSIEKISVSSCYENNVCNWNIWQTSAAQAQATAVRITGEWPACQLNTAPLPRFASERHIPLPPPQCYPTSVPSCCCAPGSNWAWCLLPKSTSRHSEEQLPWSRPHQSKQVQVGQFGEQVKAKQARRTDR